MSIVQSVLVLTLSIYQFVLIGRLVFELVQAFARSWRPTGIVLVLAEVIYTLTDPPLKFVRRFVRPIRLGSVALDLSFIILFFVVVILIEAVTWIPVG